MVTESCLSAIVRRAQSSSWNTSQPPNSSIMGRYFTRLRLDSVCKTRKLHNKGPKSCDAQHPDHTPYEWFPTSVEGCTFPSQASVRKPPANTPYARILMSCILQRATSCEATGLLSRSEYCTCQQWRRG